MQANASVENDAKGTVWFSLLVTVDLVVWGRVCCIVRVFALKNSLAHTPSPFAPPSEKLIAYLNEVSRLKLVTMDALLAYVTIPSCPIALKP